jgi:hypothetical protein
MRRIQKNLLGTLGTVLFLAFGAAPVRSDTGPQKPFGIGRRVPWTTSRLVGSPDPLPKYRLTRVFPQFVLKEPVFIAQDPASDRFMVAEYTPGRIYSFLPNDSTCSTAALWRLAAKRAGCPGISANSMATRVNPVPPFGESMVPKLNLLGSTGRASGWASPGMPAISLLPVFHRTKRPSCVASVRRQDRGP